MASRTPDQYFRFQIETTIYNNMLDLKLIIPICNLRFEILFSAFLRVPFQQLQGHQSDADTDGRVCNIEGRPMVR